MYIEKKERKNEHLCFHQLEHVSPIMFGSSLDTLEQCI